MITPYLVKSLVPDGGAETCTLQGEGPLGQLSLSLVIDLGREQGENDRVTATNKN